MDCRTARLLFEVAGPLRPAELEAADAENLERHLSDCAECAAAAQALGREDEVLGRAMSAVPLPPGLRGRLLTRLDAERDMHNRRQTRRWLTMGAAAAVVLIAAW